MSSDDSTEIYRLRGIDKILGEKYQELERQTIYFAPPDALNDPMEGFRDMFWHGDFIVWRNLFNHYLLCLERLCSLLIIGGEEHPISKDQMPVFHGENDFPTPQYANLFDAISQNFFSKKGVTECVKAISQRTTPIRRDELFFYFSSLHMIGFKSIFDEYKKNGLHEGVDVNPLEESTQHILKFIEATEAGLREDGYDDQLFNIIFSFHKDRAAQINLIARYNGKAVTNNKDLVLLDFPEVYISQIEKLVFPNWYTAAFTSRYENSSSWGHYAGEHKGVCLIFDSTINGDRPSLLLRGKNGFSSSGPTYGHTNHAFYPITYKAIDAPIDFFRMLGRLPMPTLNAMWYVHDGKTSKCADEMHNAENEWRKQYWDRFYRDIMVKSKDWEHENEQRLILAEMMSDFSAPKDRTLTYDFKSLKGIIFGIKTKIEDKLEIIKIIDEKCTKESRTDFKFYQAHYSPETGGITRSEMSLLRFSKESK